MEGGVSRDPKFVLRNIWTWTTPKLFFGIFHHFFYKSLTVLRNVIGDVKRTQTEVAVNHKWTSFSQGLLYILTTTTTRMMTIHIFNADAHSGCLSQKMIT